MDTQEIVKELKAGRNRLEEAIAALDGTNATRTIVTANKPSIKSASAPRKHRLSAAGRKRLSVLMKKRWADKKKKSFSGHK